MPSITPGQPLAGCEVVYLGAGREAILRCPCGQTFPADKAAATREGAQLRCPECRQPPVALVPALGTRMRLVYDLIVNMKVLPGEAARRVGVAAQTAERVMERFVVPNRLRARIAELEAQLAGRTPTPR